MVQKSCVCWGEPLSSQDYKVFALSAHCLTGLTELLHEPQGVLIYYGTLGTCNQEYSRGCQTLEMVEINEALLLLS